MTNSNDSAQSSPTTPPNELPVLDNGFVRLEQIHGDDLMVVNAARVSFSKRSHYELTNPSHGEYRFDLNPKDVSLINYLARHGHWTPFGHPQITLHMRMPIFVARQFMRSNVGIVYNEESRRYVDHAPIFHNPTLWRNRPQGSIKQGSGDAHLNDTDDAVAAEAYRVATEACMSTYNTLLSLGVAPEQARMILPVSMYTELWATMSLAAVARVCRLRMDPHAQKEIQDYAIAITALVRPHFPVSLPALLS